MTRNYRFLVIPLFFSFSLACITIATPTPALDFMSTVGALQTDVAAATKTIGAVLSASTSAPSRTPTLTLPTRTITPTLPSPTPTEVGIKVDHAEFVSETVPDGSVMAPGVIFRKSWRLINRGQSTWKGGYALVFVDGYQMEAQEEVQLPQEVPPDKVVNLSITLKAPPAKGEYTGYWMLRNDKGVNFGVGLTDEPISVNIIVGDPWETANGPIKSIVVEQLLELENPYDCFSGVQVTFKGTIVVNSPGEVTYIWRHNGVSTGLGETHRFIAAGEKLEVFHDWTINAPIQGSVDMVILKPYEIVSNSKDFEIICN